MTVPPKFVQHDPTAWWRESEARRREQMASAQLQAMAYQQQAAAIAQGRAEGLAAQRHREMMAATVANKPRPSFWSTIPSAWWAAAAIGAYRGWKRRPSEFAVGYRRAPGDPVIVRSTGRPRG